jgi:hypothetical protein
MDENRTGVRAIIQEPACLASNSHEQKWQFAKSAIERFGERLPAAPRGRPRLRFRRHGFARTLREGRTFGNSRGWPTFHR